MKKYFIYLGLVLAGFVLGWFLFKGPSNATLESAEVSKDTKTTQMWTCSMHPQILQPEPGDCPICGMDLIPVEEGSEGLSANQFKLTDRAMALAGVQTTVVGNASTLDNSIILTGKIVENETANTVQASYFSGRIEQLHVNYTGEQVNKGQLLANIYSPELYAAQQELLTASEIKSNQPELYKAVRSKLKLLKLTDKQIDAIESSGTVRERFPVYATVSGTVIEKMVETGDYIKQGQPLFKIANLNTVWANFDVYENQVEHFKKGQSIEITLNAYPDRSFTAVVDFIDPVLNNNTRVLKLRTVLQNTDDIFKPGMFVKGSVVVQSKKGKDRIVIPSSAVLWTGERSVVYIKTISNQAVFEMRQVTIGNKIGDSYEVIGGLSNGDEIVTNGTFTVDAAAQLQGKASMMNATRKAEENEQPLMVSRISVSNQFQKELQVVYNGYKNVKNALVEDNPDDAQKMAKLLVEALKNIDMGLLTEDNAHNEWMKLYKDLEARAEGIAVTNVIEKQRNQFIVLSESLLKALQLFGIQEKVYLQHCPMANSNKGAYWLSGETSIRNPYFGSSMLRCGEVKDTIN
ncbi:efflux RND transporter periplasmic adaptor subunit [Mangrovimonas aestuarii]|uniref:efflux RND transporter periplasmic adaptor subunit n=1 Tax=Mangrovimonas aestuarii TaxID=3018443 RepID=UPI002378B147|nr:efflux RND transporter periplasmic adaptor subunit [Mangrovimonas aestuarii]